MNSLWKRFVLRNATRGSNNSAKQKPVSQYRFAKAHRYLIFQIKRNIKDFFFITIGIVAASFGLKGFLLSNKFIDGGVTGISLLVSALTKIPLPLLIIGINIPFVLLGYKILGRSFAIKTAIAISGLAVCLATVNFPVITSDHLLVAVFGGFFLGTGIGLSIRGGAVIDGTEVLAIFLSRKLSTTIGDIIIIINIIIFSTAAYLLTVEIALYSMVTYMAASKALDFVVEGIEEYIGVTIISSRPEDIRQMIINTLGRGVTVYSGKRGYGKRGDTKDVDIIYTVITRLELNKLHSEIERIEPHAFVVMNAVKDTRGGMIKKRPLKH
jgi:uncharacterized membrane-anchored protein YitT (DUF2179 family)